EYFRATDKNTLKSIFEEIDKLEKTQMDVKQYSNTEDNYMPWALLLLLLVCIELTARYTVLRSIP
ncbi:MAG: aerotolerance regulator BatA, partial [Muribaculaceae bacterium]|nr:aerotolerance regulator BatA [Muribaculaceae bacterium]